MKQGRTTPQRPSGCSSVNFKMDRSPHGSQGTTDHSASSPSNNFNTYARSLQFCSLLDHSIAEFSSAEIISKEAYRITRSQSPPQYESITINEIKQLVRKKSSDSISFPIILNYQKLKAYLQSQKLNSEIELIEISNFIDHIRDCSKVNYFSIILGDLNMLVDSIISQSQEQILIFEAFKDIILKFDKLRADYQYKLKGNSKSQAISKENVEFLNIIFGYIRFILTRFGRIINYFDFLEQHYNRKQLSKQLSHSKTDPTIGRLQHMDTGSDSGSDLHSRNNNLTFKGMTSLATSLRVNQLFVLEDKMKREKVREVLFELTDKEKNYQIEKYMKILGNKWVEEYEEDRKLNIPLVLCRLCNQNFYADRESQHSKYCHAKIEKVKEQVKVNKLFLDLKSQATDCIIEADQKNQQIINTPNMLGISAAKSRELLQTPTLRARMPNLQSMQANNADYLNTPKPTYQSLSQMQSMNFLTAPSIKKTPEDSKEKRSSTFKKNQNQPLPTMSTLKTYDSSETEGGDKKWAMIDNPNAFKEEIKSDLAKIPPLKNHLSTHSQQQQPMNNPQSQLLKYVPQMNPLNQMNPIGMRNPQQQNQPQAKDTSLVVNALKGLEGMKKFESVEEKKEIKNQDQVSAQSKMLKQATFGNLKKLEGGPAKEEEKKAPNMGYFASLCGNNSQAKDQQEKKDQPQVRPAIVNVSSFMKSQIKEEKKNLDESVKVIDVRQVDTADDEEPTLGIQPKKSLPFKKIQELNSVFLPKSPYLQKMHCAFRDVAKINNAKVTVEPIKGKAQEQIQRKPSTREPISSPYIGFVKGRLSKEQRVSLKNYIQKEITKGINTESKKTDKHGIKKENPTSNAFTLNFKNHREEVLKNIETLRKSVKLAKRANPLEKIMTKMAKQEELKLDNTIQKSNKKPQQNQLQSIQEEDVNWGPHLDLKDHNFEEKKVDRKILDIKSKDSQKFKGMSPIITFRPLNNVHEKATSFSNTPVGTPSQSKNNSVTPRHQMFSDASSINTTEDKLKVFQNAKKELDILESIKKIANEAFNLSNNSQMSFNQQKKIFQSYLSQVKETTTKFAELLRSEKAKIVTKKLEEVLEMKVQELEEILSIEKNYDKTLPLQAKKARQEQERMSQYKMEKIFNNSISSKEDRGGRNSKRGSFYYSNTFKDHTTSNSPITQQQLISNLDKVAGDYFGSNIVNRVQTQKNIENSRSPQSIISSNPSQMSLGSGQQFTPQMIKSATISKTPLDPQKNQYQTNFLPQIPPYRPKRDSHRMSTQSSQLDEVQEEKQNEDGTKQQIVFTKKKSQFNINNSHTERQVRSRTVSRQPSSNSFSETSSEELQDLEEHKDSIQGLDFEFNKAITAQQPRKTQDIRQVRLNLPLTKRSGKQNNSKGRRSSMLDKFQINKQSTPSNFGIPSKGSLFVKKAMQKSNEHMKLSQFGKQKNKSLSPTRLSLKVEKKFMRRSTAKKVQNFNECQSDIVVGMNYNKEIEESDREIYSDFHDFLFVEDLFEDNGRFNEVLDRLNELDEGYESEEVLTMEEVRFNSVVILPSEIESCSIEKLEQSNQQNFSKQLLQGIDK